MSSYPDGAVPPPTTSMDFLQTHLQDAIASSLQAIPLKFSLIHAVLIAAVTYLILVQMLRFSRLRKLERKYSDRWTRTKDGKRRLNVTPAEAQEIMHLAFKYDLPSFARFAMVFALFKTYAIPTISDILVKSGQLSSKAFVAKRYTDTEVLITTWASCPFVDLANARLSDMQREEMGKVMDPRGAIAIARVNYLHAKWPAIRQRDLLYTLSLFLLEPARWAKLYGWRPITEMEEQAFFIFWAEIGRRMNIEDIPESLDELKEWVRKFEEAEVAFAPSNFQVGVETLELLLALVPRFLGRRLRLFGRELIISLLEDRTRVAFGLPEPSKAARFSLHWIITSIALVQRYLCLPRIMPFEVVPAEVSPSVIAKAEREGSLPRQHVSEATREPWYLSEPIGITRFFQSLWVNLRLSDANLVPGPQYKSQGYRLEECGPKSLEQAGHAEVMAAASKIQGCPVSGPWARD